MGNQRLTFFIIWPRILACPSSPPVTIQAVSVKASAQWHLLPNSTQGAVAHDEIWLELLFWRFLLWSVPRSDAAGLYRALGQSFRKDANARCVQMETVRVMTRSWTIFSAGDGAACSRAPAGLASSRRRAPSSHR